MGFNFTREFLYELSVWVVFMILCSVGSLGRNGAHEEVSDVEVAGCTFEGTTNGVRIKTWQVHNLILICGTIHH